MEADTQKEWSVITVTPVLMKLLQHTNSMVSNVTIPQLIIINPIKRKPWIALTKNALHLLSHNSLNEACDENCR